MNSGHNIVATVYVQAQSMYRQSGPVEMRPIGETEFVNGVAAMFASGARHTRACAAIVGRADLTLGSRVEPVLQAHLRAGGDRFRGVRHIASWDADTRLNNPDYPSPPALLKDRTFREGIAVLARLGCRSTRWSIIRSSTMSPTSPAPFRTCRRPRIMRHADGNWRL